MNSRGSNAANQVYAPNGGLVPNPMAGPQRPVPTGPLPITQDVLPAGARMWPVLMRTHTVRMMWAGRPEAALPGGELVSIVLGLINRQRANGVWPEDGKFIASLYSLGRREAVRQIPLTPENVISNMPVPPTKAFSRFQTAPRAYSLFFFTKPIGRLEDLDCPIGFIVRTRDIVQV